MAATAQTAQATQTNGTGPAPTRTAFFQPLTFDQLMQQPAKQWLIDRVLGAGDVGMIFGEAGTGKTFVVIDLIFAACLGKPWTARFQESGSGFQIARPLRVAYCGGEGVGGLPDRFRAAADGWGVTSLPNFDFYPLAPQLYIHNRTDGIDNFVADWQARPGAPTLDVLVIDTLATAIAGADENSAQDMGKVLDRVRAASRALGCAVLLVHHSKKGGGDYRGSSSLHGAMDCMLEVAKNGQSTLEVYKLKDAEAWPKLTFTLTAKHGGSAFVIWDGLAGAGGSGGSKSQTTRSEVLEILQDNPQDRFTAAQLAKAIGETTNATTKALKELQKQGKAERHTAQGGRDMYVWALASSLAAAQP